MSLTREAYADLLDASQWWPSQAIAHRQGQLLARLVDIARRETAWYKKSLARLPAVDPGGDWRAWLSRAPILQRGDLQQFGQELVTNDPKGTLGKTTWVESSGSSGQVVMVRKSQINAVAGQAFANRRATWHGVNVCKKVALLSDRYLGRSLHWMSVAAPTIEQAAWLAALQPDGLLVYPSCLAGLLDVWPQGLKLKVIGTTAEKLSPELRQRCREVTKCEVFDSYSCEEIGNLAIECPDCRQYHLQAEHVIVEVLNDDDQPCKFQETGRVVVTALHSEAMPLIRYEIGDYATVGHACPGGRNLGSLSAVVGRTRNLLRHPDGRARWPEGLSRIARAGNIRDFSFVQTSLSKIEMQICAPIDSTSHEAVLGACKEILGPEFAYEVVVVDPSTLRRGSRRKQEEFRSLVAVA